MGNKAWSVITLIFVGFLIVLIVTHAKGFSTAAGSLFTGVNQLGTTLTGANIKSGT
jgi:hypothetical protein